MKLKFLNPYWTSIGQPLSYPVYVIHREYTTKSVFVHIYVSSDRWAIFTYVYFYIFKSNKKMTISRGNYYSLWHQDSWIFKTKQKMHEVCIFFPKQSSLQPKWGVNGT